MEFWQRIMNISTKHRQAILGIAYRLPLLFWIDLRLRVNQVDASRQGYAFCLVWKRITSISKEHVQAIFGIVHRLPLLLWIDLRLRVNQVNASHPGYAFYLEMISLCLLLVNKRLLAYIYRFIACAIVIVITWPLVKEKKIIELLYVVKTYLLVSSARDNALCIHLYLCASVCLLCIALFLSSISILKELSNNIRKRTILLSFLFVASCFTCFTGIFRLEVQQCIIIFITYDVFQINFYLFMVLTSFATIFSEIDVPFYVYCTGALTLLYLNENRNENVFKRLVLEVNGFFADCSLKLLLKEGQQVILFQSLFLCISFLFKFYFEIHTASIGNLFLYTVTTYTATIIGTISYIASITYACYGILLFSISLIDGQKHNIEIKVPASPAVLVIVMALQTLQLGNITHGRVMVISLFLIACPLLDEMRKAAEPVLLELGTSGGHVIQNCKAIFLFVLLLVLPPIIIGYFMNLGIFNHFSIFYVLVFTSSWIAVSIETLGSLLVYAFLIVDSLMTEPMQGLDDNMYTIRAAVGLIQIIFGLIHVFYVGWSITAVHWSWVGCFLFVSCIFNSYCKVKDGWQDFERRRLTAQSLSFLPHATEKQLEELDDVCSVCLRNMSSAKITPCDHYFHESCLKKWSYIKDTCPMCNKVVNVFREKSGL